MGSWGPGIFSDDLAADVRAEWREAIVAGEETAPASRALIARHRDERDDPVFWLALAAAQMETGRLQPRVRDRALALIDAGADLASWSDPRERAARERGGGGGGGRGRGGVRRGPQPAPKRLRGPRAGPHPGVEAGDVLRLW